METRNNEEIRETVRQSYGKIARAGGVISESSQRLSCCGPSETATGTIRQSSGCGAADFSGENISAIMGYSEEDIGSVPEGANMGLGCGNPVAVASLNPGETVVDLGSGGGFDCFLAGKEVGETGKVIGVDMTPDMVGKARKNAEKMGTKNVEFRLGEIEHLPVADNSADIIMSNCVINLSPEKPEVYRDAFRVLKPGGRLAISDIIATARLPEEIKKNLTLVSACVGGAATIDETEDMLKQAGFRDIKINAKEISRELISEWAPGSNAGDYVVSAYIEAVKPMDL
ncbi:arsenite methyltransferase [Thermodesulfobacteriota bacterium]